MTRADALNNTRRGKALSKDTVFWRGSRGYCRRGFRAHSWQNLLPYSLSSCAYVWAGGKNVNEMPAGFMSLSRTSTAFHTHWCL